MRCDNPDCRGAALVVLLCIIGLLLSTIFIARSYFREVEIDPPVVTHLVDAGVAKAYMIKELTGHEFPPEIARHAVISFSGTSVAVDTEKLNIWLGKNWESKK